MMHVDEAKIKQYLLNYQNPDITRRDVMNTLGHYHGLSCKLEPFVFNDGTKKELFNVQGTIPVTYKVFSNGAKKTLVNLNGTIPVLFKGTTKAFRSENAIVKKVNKADVRIMSGMSPLEFLFEQMSEVVLQGNIYNIPICIWLMDTHPNNAPMCYVKPTADMQIKVSMFVDHNGKIYLPYLHDWVPNSSDLLGLIHVMIVTFGEQPPVYAKQRTDMPPTPYPTQPYMPMPTASGSATSSTTPYPPYPTSTSNAYTGGYHPTPYPPAGYPNFPGMPYPPYPSSNSHAYPGYPPAYPPTSQTSPPPATSASSSGGTTGTITEEHIRASLLSAVEDKLRRRLREQFSQTQAELETLGRTQQELLQGKNKLDDILTRLDKEQVELDKNITILQDKEQELEKAIERLSEQQPIDVDEAVTTTAPLYKQLLNAFAEEAATEDAIYYMGEALRRGVIDLDVFLKQVRTLSRKQFMLRALMHKCRQKAGLAG